MVAEVLSPLAKEFWNTIWECLFEELQAVATVDRASGLPEWLNENIGQDMNDSGRGADMERWCRAQDEQISKKHNRKLVPFFLSLAANDGAVSNIARYKLPAWLTLFGGFTTLVNRAILSHPDRTLVIAAGDTSMETSTGRLLTMEAVKKPVALPALLWSTDGHLTTQQTLLTDSTLFRTRRSCSRRSDSAPRSQRNTTVNLCPSSYAASSFARYKLHAWLTLISKFTNPKAFQATEALFIAYRALLSHPDCTLQTVALSCVLTHKPPNLVRHEETLWHLLDDTLRRDEPTHLDTFFARRTDRPMFVDTTIRLLFGTMLEKKGRTKGGGRRAAVLSAPVVCTEDELWLLVNLMLKPTGSSSLAWQGEGFVLTEVPSSASSKQQVGFFNLLGRVLWHLGPRVVPHWPALLGTALNLTAFAQTRLGGLKKNEVPVASGGPNEVQGEDEEDREDAHKNVDEGLITRTWTKGDQHLSSPLAQRQISVLSQVAHHIADPAQASVLVGLLAPSLCKLGKWFPKRPR
ncbi:down-regulated in metastasis-domain-containing protein [Boletus edulis]|nr:down-regulated in metastasis-domain-containing protein [Boletus edulis]